MTVQATLPGDRGGWVLLRGALDVPEGRVGVHPCGPETGVAVYSFWLGLHGARLRACAFKLCGAARLIIIPATIVAGGASSGSCDRVNLLLTVR